MSVTVFEIDESLELMDLRHRRENLTLSSGHMSRLQKYLKAKRLHQKQESAEAAQIAFSCLAGLDPVVRELRHSKVEAARFPVGSRIRALFDEAETLRAPLKTLEREYSELAAQQNSAQAAFDAYDVERAKSPREYYELEAAASFYAEKMSLLFPRVMEARREFDHANSCLLSAYREYGQLVNELNSIKPLTRPLAARKQDRDERAREVGEVARLEYLIDTILRAPVVASALSPARA
jgi:chromosome segregation ATPase